MNKKEIKKDWNKLCFSDPGSPPLLGPSSPGCHRGPATRHNTASAPSSINKRRRLEPAGWERETERRWMESGRLWFVLLFTLCSALPGSQSTHSLWGRNTVTHTRWDTETTEQQGKTINWHNLVCRLESVAWFFISVLHWSCTENEIEWRTTQTQVLFLLLQS